LIGQPDNPPASPSRSLKEQNSKAGCGSANQGQSETTALNCAKKTRQKRGKIHGANYAKYGGKLDRKITAARTKADRANSREKTRYCANSINA
jgi:hypothetical protein